MNAFPQDSAAPTVSLVVTSYNQLDLLQQALTSIERQNRPFDEVIVVDDASTDGSQNFLDGWVREDLARRLIKNDRNEGLSATRNRGMDAAKMNYVAFLDGDDWYAPEACAEMCRTIGGGTPDVIFFGFRNFDQTRGAFLERTHGSSFYSQEPLACTAPETLEEIGALFRMIPATWMKMYRRAFLVEKDLRSDGLHYEDTLWTLKCVALAESIRCTPKTLINYRMHLNSYLHQCSDSHFSFFEISEKCETFLAKQPNIPQALVAASRRFRFNLCVNAVLNTGRIPESSKPRYARRILDQEELTTFTLDARERDLLARVKAMAAGD